MDGRDVPSTERHIHMWRKHHLRYEHLNCRSLRFLVNHFVHFNSTISSTVPFSLPNIAQSYWHLGMHQKGNTALERYGIDSYELHPRFVNSSGYDDFDLAIVTLNKRIQFNRNMKPICLPSGAGNYFGKLTTVAGWLVKLFARKT